MPALGLSGLASSGKTTAANYLERVYAYRRKHIATTLRSMLAVLLRDLGYGPEDIHDILEGSRKDGWIIPEIGRTSRYLQITIGTEFGRDLVHPDLWVKTWSHGIGPDDRVMNDSVRFSNEEAEIQRLGGFTILIERPGTKPAQFLSELGQRNYETFGFWDGVHPSERIDLLNPTDRIVNDGTLEDLYGKLDAVMARHGVARQRAHRAA